MSEPMHSKTTNPLLLIGLPALAVVIAGFALYFALVRVPAQADLKAQQDLVLRLTGVTQAVSNHLDPAYVDADGDLLADLPTEPAKILDPDVLRISYIATDEPETYQTAFKELCDAIAKATGKKVEYVLLRSSTEELKALRDGQIQIAGFNTGNVPRAVNVAGFIPVAATADSAGNPLIRSIIIAAAGSRIMSVSDIKGRDFLLTDAGSNSGYRAPLSLLKEHGLLPVRDYGMRYSGSHEASIEAIAAGTADAAAVASDILARELATGAIKKEAFRILLESNTFPAGTIGYAYNLKPELAAKIRDAILSFSWSGTGLEKTLGPGGSAKFVPIKFKDDFALVRRIDDDTGNSHKLDQ